jgi:hypothetical protein
MPSAAETYVETWSLGINCLLGPPHWPRLAGIKCPTVSLLQRGGSGDSRRNRCHT